MISNQPTIGGPAYEVHLDALLDVSVRLVNGLTGDWVRGAAMMPLEGDERRTIVADALAGADRTRPAVEPDEAKQLARTAGLLRRAFDAVSSDDFAAAAEIVNGLMRSTGARPELVYRGEDAWALHFPGKDYSLANGWGAGCATALAMAIGSKTSGRLGGCNASRCDQVFVDISRNGVRRYCSTSCQNRMKSEAFRQRRR